MSPDKGFAQNSNNRHEIPSWRKGLKYQQKLVGYSRTVMPLLHKWTDHAWQVIIAACKVLLCIHYFVVPLISFLSQQPLQHL